VTLDGYFTDKNGDMSWAHRQNDPEWSAFTAENAKSGGELLMGSGTIISQIALEGVIDEYQMVVNPIALGKGRTMFDGIEDKLNLTLTSTRAFKNGNVLLCYKP
jgi:dihydrofolate reductase